MDIDKTLDNMMPRISEGKRSRLIPIIGQLHNVHTCPYCGEIFDDLTMPRGTRRGDIIRCPNCQKRIQVI